MVSMNKPKVSVGVLSYNNAKYLALTIESILSQTYDNFELIVVDDGSTDDSLIIARKFEELDSRIKIYTHPNHINKGISATCNLAVKKSKGDYISLLASDDIYYPNYLEMVIDYLESNKNVGFVYGEVQRINEKGENLPEICSIDISKEKDPIKHLLSMNSVSAPTVMSRRECYENLGLYDEDLVYSDWDLWIRFLTVYKIGFIPKKLTKYRIHDTNISVNAKPELQIERINRFYQKIKQKLYTKDATFGESKFKDIIDKQIALLPAREAKMHIDNYYKALNEGKSLTAALSHIKKAHSVAPSTILKPRTIAAIIKQTILKGLLK